MGGAGGFGNGRVSPIIMKVRPSRSRRLYFSLDHLHRWRLVVVDAGGYRLEIRLEVDVVFALVAPVGRRELGENLHGLEFYFVYYICVFPLK